MFLPFLLLSAGEGEFGNWDIDILLVWIVDFLEQIKYKNIGGKPLLALEKAPTTALHLRSANKKILFF
jgi:hypothetical protein